MWEVYIYSFLAGFIGTSGIPHFIKGVMGQTHQTPFKKGSSAAINVIWGWINFLVASIFLYFSHLHTHRIRAFILFAFGSLIMAILLADNWSKHPEFNRPNK